MPGMRFYYRIGSGRNCIRLWLDDVRPPQQWGRIGWTWVKTADDAIDLLRTGKVSTASLDHDLSWEHYAITGLDPRQFREKTGMAVVEFLEEHPEYFPPGGVTVHSQHMQRAEEMRHKLATIMKRKEDK